jgi:hypothetical protein
MGSTVDHVLVCVPDLDDSVAVFEAEHGVASVPGGRHRGHGTANRLVPLGESYVELVAVVDAEEAGASSFGRWVAARSPHPGADGMAIRTNDLDAVCARLGIEPTGMSRPTSTGEELRWRIAGIERLVTSGLPFFIQWDVHPGLHPGRIPITHPRGSVTLSRVHLSGDLDQLETWTAGTTGLDLEGGDPVVRFDLA